MRTGAIIARGSCKALKWMAVLGVVFALGAGAAAAQEAPSTDALDLVDSYGNNGIKVDMSATSRTRVGEGDERDVVVSVRARIAAGTTARHDVTLHISAALASGQSETSAKSAEAEDYDLDGVTGDNGALTFTFDRNDSSNIVTQTITETFTIDANEDDDAEAERFTVTIDTQDTNLISEDQGDTAVPNILRNVEIVDDEKQDYAFELERRADPMEGAAGSFVVELGADPDPEDATLGLTLKAVQTADKSKSAHWGYGFSGTGIASNELTLNSANVSRDITVSTPSNDGNRVTDMITLQAYTGSAGSGKLVAEIDIEVEDIHTLPDADDITAVAMDKEKDGEEVTEVEEGGDPVYLTITIDRGSGSNATTAEELTINVRPANAAQAADYEIDPSRFVLEEVPRADGEQSTETKIELTALSDEDVGAEELVLDLEVTGVSDYGTEVATGTFKITIVDATVKKVEPKSEDEAYAAIKKAMEDAAGDDGLNPGESFSIMTSDLFTVMDGYTANYGVSVEGSSVGVSASNEMVTITAASPGESVVTVTATVVEASSFKSSQQASDVAQIMFPVSVALENLTYSVMGPSDMNLVEGSSAMVKVMASRALNGDETAEVMLMRDGGSSASMDDYSVMPETVMLKAGDMEAEFTVTAVEDNIPDAGTGTNTAEMLTLFLVVDDMQMTDKSVMFYIWDMAVPALPLIAQLLLAGILGVGGYRRYRRR